MGYGTNRNGIGLNGADAVLNRSAKLATQPPTAALFDPKTRTFPVLANGQLQAVHPIDQRVVLALWPRKGAIKSVSAQGHTFADLARLTSTQKQPAAERIVRDLLATMIKNGDITLLKVIAGSPVRGRDEIAVEYVNNRTGAKQITKVT